MDGVGSDGVAGCVCLARSMHEVCHGCAFRLCSCMPMCADKVEIIVGVGKLMSRARHVCRQCGSDLGMTQWDRARSSATALQGW